MHENVFVFKEFQRKVFFVDVPVDGNDDVETAARGDVHSGSQSDVDAQFNLGFMYDEGRIVLPNPLMTDDSNLMDCRSGEGRE